jgi:oxygen-dependent protoporphyrinogen oxidase
MKKIAILGAGISGLTTAFLLKKKGHKVTVFEKSHRTGGYIGTQYKDKYVVENGANGFLNNEPKTLDLINQLNLHNELISAKQEAKIRYLLFDGKMRTAPSKLPEFLKSDLLSFGAKIKVINETWFPPAPQTDTAKLSIYDFIKYHFGEEISENIIRTALLGVFAGDAKLLSVSKAFPKFISMEAEHKSLLKAFKNSIQKDGKSNLTSFKKGMQTLIDKLTSELGTDIELSREVIKIVKNENKFSITAQSDEDDQNFHKFDDIIVTLPAPEISKLLGILLNENLLNQFPKYPIAPVRTLTFAFKEKVNFKGFGTLISPKENLNILGFLHPKDIFENRCPEDKDLFTVMMGGVFKPEIMKMSTQASFDVALKELEKILGKLPPVEQFWNWSHAPGISQYNVDQVDFMNELEQKFKEIPGIHLNSQMLGGVSINDCIRKSFDLVSTFEVATPT